MVRIVINIGGIKMDILLAEFLALLVFFGGLYLASIKLLGAFTVGIFLAGTIYYFLYNGVFLLFLAFILSLIGIAWKVRISKWIEYMK